MGILMTKDMIKRFKPLFSPESLVFFGASKDPQKWGFIILANLIDGGFQGRIYPVNPRENDILGLKVYRLINDIPEVPDLAVIVVPPSSIIPIVKDCVREGVRASVVITAGFAETGEKGKRLQQEMVNVAHAGGMFLVGPNCNGIMNPMDNLYVQMPSIFPHPGPIAIVAQSGNVALSLARQAMIRGFGCSKYISSGNEADLHFEDYLSYLAEDPQTRVILGYVEGIKDGRRFYRIAKEVSVKKPIVLLKAGSTPAGARAAMSHTASLAGSDAVFEAVCRQSGVIRARDLEELLSIGVAFLRQPLPRGRRVGIVTAGGGWGVLAADACIRDGLEVVPLPSRILTELDSFLPHWWSRGNPVDLVAGVRGDAVLRSIEALLACEVVDSVILLGIMTTLPVERPRLSGTFEDRERWEEKMLLAVVDLFSQLDNLSERYQKPIIVASELPFEGQTLHDRITCTLGRTCRALYTQPHHATSVVASLFRYGVYLRESAG